VTWQLAQTGNPDIKRIPQSERKGDRGTKLEELINEAPRRNWHRRQWQTPKRRWCGYVHKENSSLLREHSFSNGLMRSAWTTLGRSQSISLASIIFSRLGIQPLSSSLDATLGDAGIFMQTRARRIANALKTQSYCFEANLDEAKSRIVCASTWNDRKSRMRKVVHRGSWLKFFKGVGAVLYGRALKMNWGN